VHFLYFYLKNLKLLKVKNIFLYMGGYLDLVIFLSSLYWISISLTFDQNFKFLIPISLILVPLFLGIFYGLATLCFIISNSKKVVSSFLVFSLFFCSF
jgi:apolipoprotein N-acyltransferase